MALTIIAALLRPKQVKVASYVVVAGALLALTSSIFDWVYPAYKWGMASVNSDRRIDQFTIACELPVLVLALISVGYFRRLTFWLAWTISLIYVLWWAVVIIWLEFFWHW